MNATVSIFMKCSCPHCSNMKLMLRSDLKKGDVLATCYMCRKASWFSFSDAVEVNGYRVGEKHE